MLMFWGIVAAVVFGTSQLVPVLNFRLISDTLALAFSGDIAGLSTQEFAFALALAITAVALGFLAAFAIMHAFLIRLSVRAARRVITAETSPGAFAAHYDVVYQRLSKHPLIGCAWRAFDETLVRRPDEDVVRNTLRPSAFVSMGSARERLFGLKMMGSIPGYFVGVGLFLTFIGLVLALHKASAAVSSNDAAGMQIATRELLQVATFKFATSIAGLGSSIALSIFFRVYTIWIEGAFNRFNEDLEDRLCYTGSQSIALEMNQALDAQLTELKQINSADFFARMGENISPQIQAAFTTAIAPVTASIDQAISRLTDSSQTGMSDLVGQFTQSLQVGAGTELRELAETLKTMQGALLEAQGGIGKTGEDFGRRMTEAAENLNRLVSEAGGRMNEGAEESRKALVDVVGALRETFERANQKVDERLGAAASSASGKVEEAMGRVMAKLESQVDGIRDSLGSFHDGMSRQLTETNQQVSAAQAGAVNAVAAASTEAAQALQAGLAGAMQSVRGELEQFTTTLRTIHAGMSSQVEALRDTTNQSRLAADAFGQTAQDVRAASAPLLQSGEKISTATQALAASVTGASERMSGSVTDASAKLAESVVRSVSHFEAGQKSALQLSDSLKGQIDQLSTVWTGYAAQFERVDEDLGSAVDGLSEAVKTQGQQLADYASKVDQGFATAISRLNPFLEELKSNTEDLGDAVSDLRGVLIREAAE